MSLAPIDGKLFAFYGLEIFANNYSSIGARDTKIPPLDARHYDDSNEPNIVVLRPLGGEQFRLQYFTEIQFFYQFR
jgi:hypothetical protein